MNPVQKKTDIRSTTLFGLSVINVMFEDRVDDFTARQQVYNLLNDADLPDGVTPEVQPLYGPTGEIFRYTLRSDKRSVRELKTIQDWVIERNLRSVSGVADIVSFGGEVKTFEVSVNPHQLINYGITALELYNAIANSNIIKTLQNAFGVEDLSKADLQKGAKDYMKAIGLTDAEITDLMVNLGYVAPVEPVTPSKPATGDAGIVVYLGLGVMALAGGVLVAKKKEQF